MLESVAMRPPARLGGYRPGRFGHLREVGMNGFVPAIESEEASVWVVVHIYDSVRLCLVRIHPRLCVGIMCASADTHPR